uniref:(California timema) hypothetical protein n=1 Tax=Timema californicum TaxID=61474 RepID=A0A7R9PC74_TIMCA|nr:unnamed protein product [Timema californicum]
MSASIASIATPIGCLICGPLLDRFGRKITLLAITPCFFLGWLILAVSPSPCPIGILYLGRILTGLATGLASVPAAVYLAEISEHSIRGMLVTFPSVAISLGILIVYVLGMFFNDNWRLVAGISAVLPVSTAILLLFIPESPLWLLSKGRSYDAERAIRKLRCIKSNIQLPNNVKLELEVMRINANSNIQFKTDDKVQFDKIGNDLTGGVYYKTSSNGENNTNASELVMRRQETISNPSSDDKYLSTEINAPHRTTNNKIKTCEHEISAKPKLENNAGEYFAGCSTIEASPSTIKLPNSEEIRAHSINTNSMAEELKPRLYILLLPQTWKPIFILNSYFFFQQFSGIYVVVFYAVNIVQQAGVVINAYTATVLLGLVQLIAGIAASFALTRMVSLGTKRDVATLLSVFLTSILSASSPPTSMSFPPNPN